MNKFKESLQVTDKVKEAIKAVEEVYRSQGREMSKEDKEILEKDLRRATKKYEER